ncbi:hypothetical protein LX36DRAFT_439331 [Colletotrichum falcatum]|nr:hypothetical protein LX36DRAFT_439331 [Colletotrichum falcatum]
MDFPCDDTRRGRGGRGRKRRRRRAWQNLLTVPAPIDNREEEEEDTDRPLLLSANVPTALNLSAAAKPTYLSSFVPCLSCYPTYIPRYVPTLNYLPNLHANSTVVVPLTASLRPHRPPSRPPPLSLPIQSGGLVTPNSYTHQFPPISHRSNDDRYAARSSHPAASSAFSTSLQNRYRPDQSPHLFLPTTSRNPRPSQSQLAT